MADGTAFNQSSNPVFQMNEESLNRAVIEAAKASDAIETRCAEGLGDMVSYLGISKVRNHAYKWAGDLKDDGWREVSGSVKDIKDLPVGAIAVYHHDIPRGTGDNGSNFGHVVMTCEENGVQKYASDEIRNTPGGSVGNNPVKFFLNPNLAVHAAFIEGLENKPSATLANTFKSVHDHAPKTTNTTQAKLSPPKETFDTVEVTSENASDIFNAMMKGLELAVALGNSQQNAPAQYAGGGVSPTTNTILA